METAISSDKVLVCETCGAKGFTNAFIYCVKCLEFVIHRYCLDVIPKSSDELVIWFCDDCKSPLPSHLTLPPKLDPSHSQKEDPSDSAIVKTTRPNKKQKKKRLKKRKMNCLVAAGEDDAYFSGPNQITQCGLARPEQKSLQFQEKVATSVQHVKTTKRRRSLKKKQKKKRGSVPLLEKDEITKSNYQKCVETPLNSPLKEALVNSDSGANQIAPQSVERDNMCCPVNGIVKRKRDTIRVAATTMKHKTEKSTEHSSCESSCTDVTLKNEEDITHTEEGLKCEPDHDKLVSNTPSVKNELNKRSKEFNGSAYAPQSSYFSNNMQYNHNEPAKPRLDPVWRGSFDIIKADYDLSEGFVGHLSTKACNKVCAEATTLLSLLSLEMHSKAHLWPKSFSDSMPTDDNIALYFFPGDAENERDFEKLVNDMIDRDLAMKTTSKSAELLIFTSKVLPQSFWRFQGNYYLWGVFRGKKKDVPVSCHSDNHGLSAKSENEVKHEKEILRKVETIESKHGLSAKSENEVTREKEILKKVETIEAKSPQSPLCNYR